ncbi:hypothetical protein SAMN05519104_7793 [Rhizobiales bacterium GAS188]|nr:hypothetical protein SAMN05519104_7793 [Rhizobiales bacterium GAS188]
MNADLADRAFAKKRHHRRSKRTPAGETDRQGATTAKTTHERDDKGK